MAELPLLHHRLLAVKAQRPGAASPGTPPAFHGVGRIRRPLPQSWRPALSSSFAIITLQGAWPAVWRPADHGPRTTSRDGRAPGCAILLIPSPRVGRLRRWATAATRPTWTSFRHPRFGQPAVLACAQRRPRSRCLPACRRPAASYRLMTSRRSSRLPGRMSADPAFEYGRGRSGPDNPPGRRSAISPRHGTRQHRPIVCAGP